MLVVLPQIAAVLQLGLVGWAKTKVKVTKLTEKGEMGIQKRSHAVQWLVTGAGHILVYSTRGINVSIVSQAKFGY